MKKTYQNPTIEVVKIATQQMLASSVQTGTYSGGVVLGRENDDNDLDW